jgi:hypothetical protein
VKDYAALISAAVRIGQDSSPRSLQSAAGIIGPSDIGFCRQKAALMTKGVQQTDAPPKWSALVGTAIHNEVEAAIKATYPKWLVGSIDKVRVTATLPSGAEISGHPDVVIPEDNTVIDIKTVDGFDWVKREGTSRQHKYQRHLYAIGLCQAGILDPDKQLFVGNLYFDRSGKEPQPLLRMEEIDWSLTDEIDSWIGDVIYAVKHGEDASRDIPAAVCERICDYFTACRGALEVHDGGQLIEDQELIAAVRMFAEGRDLENEGKRLKDAAKNVLAGVNGTTGEWDVRWVEVQPTRVESFQRPGFMRLDVRKSRR